MAEFQRGERVILTHTVVFIDEFEYNNKKFARIAFEDKPWTFVIEKDSLSKKQTLCEAAPFPKCNNGEGCETCQFNEEN